MPCGKALSTTHWLRLCKKGFITATPTSISSKLVQLYGVGYYYI